MAYDAPPTIDVRIFKSKIPENILSFCFFYHFELKLKHFMSNIYEKYTGGIFRWQEKAIHGGGLFSAGDAKHC